MFDNKSTEELTVEGFLSVSADTSKHQLKIEVYDSAGAISMEPFGIAVLARTPGSAGFDYVGALTNIEPVLIVDRIISEFQFCRHAEYPFPENSTYKVFWNKIS